mmetsp:Transcript_25640/g.46290  ORF Transcript_25640/g.46290 Transcript_25640/m.46290 type:complete len:290 (-) Transcript_25640:753-1622(-)
MFRMSRHTSSTAHTFRMLLVLLLLSYEPSPSSWLIAADELRPSPSTLHHQSQQQEHNEWAWEKSLSLVPKAEENSPQGELDQLLQRDEASNTVAISKQRKDRELHVQWTYVTSVSRVPGYSNTNKELHRRRKHKTKQRPRRPSRSPPRTPMRTSFRSTPRRPSRSPPRTPQPTTMPAISDIPTSGINMGPTASPFPTTTTQLAICDHAGLQRCCRAKCFGVPSFKERRVLLANSERVLAHSRECMKKSNNARQLCKCLHCDIKRCDQKRCPKRRNLEFIDRRNDMDKDE